MRAAMAPQSAPRAFQRDCFTSASWNGPVPSHVSDEDGGNLTVEAISQNNAARRAKTAAAICAIPDTSLSPIEMLQDVWRMLPVPIFTMWTPASASTATAIVAHELEIRPFNKAATKPSTTKAPPIAAMI